MPEIHAAVVATFELVPGITLAAVWDGGPWCHVHVVDGGKYGPVLERWDMAGPCGVAAIECTPDALRQLVLFRIQTDLEGMADLAMAARCYSTPREHSENTRRPTPEFSAN